MPLLSEAPTSEEPSKGTKPYYSAYGEKVTKLWLSAYGPTPDGRPHVSSFDVIKHQLGKTPQREKFIYEVAKLVDAKCDSLNGRLCDLVRENKELAEGFKRSKRSLLTRYGDMGFLNTNPLQKAFVDCIDAAKRDIDKRKAL